MFCTKCGKEIADGSVFCPLCGQSTTGPVVAAPKAPSEVGAKASSFIQDYLKNPMEAVTSRAKDGFFLFGLISIGAYMLFHLLVILLSDAEYLDDQKISFAFSSLLIDALCFGVLILGIFLFSSVFKLNKLSLPSAISLTGLALLPLLPVYLIELLFKLILTNSDIGDSFGFVASVLNPTGFSSFIAIACIFAAIIIFSQIREASKDTAGMRSLMVVVISFACMLILRNLCEAAQLNSLIDSLF
jgi:hypothetical protein